MQQDVIRLQRRVGFQLAAPVAVFVLFTEQEFPGGFYRHRHPRKYFVHLPCSHQSPNLLVIPSEAKDLCFPFVLRLSLSPEPYCGAAAIASTISGGNPNLTFSGMTSTSFMSVNPLPRRNSTVCSPRISGADAPAVSATVLTPSSHSG